MSEYSYVAPCLMGVEGLVADELRAQDLLHGKTDFSVFPNAEDFYFHHLALRDKITDFLDKRGGYFRDMYHTGFTALQLHERAKLRDARYFSFENRSNLKLHKILFFLLAGSRVIPR